MQKEASFQIVQAITRHVIEVKQCTVALHGAPGKLPSITPTECAERIIESALTLQETLTDIQVGEQDAFS